MAINRVSRDVEETAFRQVSKLGYSPKDVRHVVLTHLHLDHNGGLPDFPWANVHVLAAEHQAAFQDRSFKSLIGYDATHWAHNPRWVAHELSEESWFSLPSTPVLEEVGRRVFLIPLVGHSPGHCGDAYVRDSQIDPDQPQSPFPKWASAFERALFTSQTVECLRNLVRDYGSQIRVFSSHDPIAFAEFIAAT